MAPGGHRCDGGAGQTGLRERSAALSHPSAAKSICRMKSKVTPIPAVDYSRHESLVPHRSIIPRNRETPNQPSTVYGCSPTFQKNRTLGTNERDTLKVAIGVYLSTTARSAFSTRTWVPSHVRISVAS